MDLADQSHRDRQLGEARQSVIHRPHVIDDFIDIPRQLQLEELRLGGQQVLQRTLRALDLARQHRFLADIHEDEQIRVRQREYRAIEATECTVRGGQQPLEFASQCQRRVGWQRRSHERPVSRRLGDVPSRTRRGCSGGRHTASCL